MGSGWRLFTLKKTSRDRKWVMLQASVSRKIIKLPIAVWNKTQKRLVKDGEVQWDKENENAR